MLAILALMSALGSAVGCTRVHVKETVEIEVFDAISLEPVADARVEHGAPTGKFLMRLDEIADSPVEFTDPATTCVYAASERLTLLPAAKSPSPPPAWRVERVVATGW